MVPPEILNLVYASGTTFLLDELELSSPPIEAGVVATNHPKSFPYDHFKPTNYGPTPNFVLAMSCAKYVTLVYLLRIG